MKHFIGLGEGWMPAVINNPTEYYFIKQQQLNFIDLNNYWIGGSTSAKDDTEITLHDYKTDDSGKGNFDSWEN